MKEKNEVTKYLKQYISMIKTQYNMHPKIIRTDNGKEYVVGKAAAQDIGLSE